MEDEPNATAESLPATGAEDTSNTSTDATAPESSTGTDVKTTESSTDAGAKSPEAEFHERVKALEGRKPKATEDSPTAETETTEPEAESSESAAKTDERTADKDQAGEPEVSHKAEPSFDKRPEWKALLKAAAPEKQKAMREELRKVFATEAALKAQVEKAKPAIEVTDRIRKAVGDDGVQNTVELIEGWHRGDKQARQILIDLLADFDRRTGEVLSSPELLQEQKDLKQRLDDGLIDEEYVTKRESELKELERLRAEKRQSEQQRTEAKQKAQERNVQTLVQERTTAINAWELKAKRDPDYVAIEDLVLAKARVLMDDRQAQAKSLLPAAAMTAVLDEALTAVKTQLKKLQPARQARQVVNQGGGSSLNSRREPANEREAFLQKIDELESRL